MKNEDNFPELQWQPDLEELKKHQLKAGNIDHLNNICVIAGELKEKLHSRKALTEADINSLESQISQLTLTAD